MSEGNEDNVSNVGRAVFMEGPLQSEAALCYVMPPGNVTLRSPLSLRNVIDRVFGVRSTETVSPLSTADCIEWSVLCSLH